MNSPEDEFQLPGIEAWLAALREDRTTVAPWRCSAGERCWLEARLVEGGTQVELGFATDSRVRNEELEQAILDEGGDLDELLADELDELGVGPLPMHHYYDRPAFRYCSRLPVAAATTAAGRKRAKAVLLACRKLFLRLV